MRDLADLRTVHVADITRRDTMHDLARDVLAMAPGRFALAGFSLGGYVAQEVLRLAPDRIEMLALLDTSVRPDTPDRSAIRKAVNASAALPGRFHGFGERLLATYLHPDNRSDPDIAGRVRAMAERLGPDVLIRQNNLYRADGSAVLRQLRIPVLIICGEDDRVTPPAEHEEMAEIVPGARLVIAPRSGHLTPIENPDFVTRALREWLLSGP